MKILDIAVLDFNKRNCKVNVYNVVTLTCGWKYFSVAYSEGA